MMANPEAGAPGPPGAARPAPQLRRGRGALVRGSVKLQGELSSLLQDERPNHSGRESRMEFSAPVYHQWPRRCIWRPWKTPPPTAWLQNSPFNNRCGDAELKKTPAAPAVMKGAPACRAGPRGHLRSQEPELHTRFLQFSTRDSSTITRFVCLTAAVCFLLLVIPRM